MNNTTNGFTTSGAQTTKAQTAATTFGARTSKHHQNFSINEKLQN